jgi:hypothetical protein
MRAALRAGVERTSKIAEPADTEISMLSRITPLKCELRISAKRGDLSESMKAVAMCPAPPARAT